MEEAIQHGRQGPKPGELLGEAGALSGEVTEDSHGHDPMWVSDQQVVPVRGQLYRFHQFWGQWAGGGEESIDSRLPAEQNSLHTNRLNLGLEFKVLRWGQGHKGPPLVHHPTPPPLPELRQLGGSDSSIGRGE